MPERTKARRRAKDVADDVNGAGERVKDEAQGAGETAQGAGETAQDAGEQVRDVGQQVGGGTRTITGELKDTFREAAIEVLKPVMQQATKSAAKYAVTKGPDLVKGRLEQAGGAGALAKDVASKGGGVAGAVGSVASGIGGKLGKKQEGESPSGTGRGRRLPVQEHVDVGVDLETAYDQFTQFEDWPQFMHRVERIEQRDDTTLMWHENIWGVRRSWEAEIVEQSPCERLVWRSKGGTQTTGVVTFHRLSDNLTRIAVTLDFQPKGLFEKTASGMRMSRRALKSDLMRFKAFIEMRDEATGQWRGRIEEGEPVDEQREEEPRASEEGEEPDEDEYEEEEEEEEEEPRAEEEDEGEEEDEEEQPRARRRGRFDRDEDEGSADNEEEEAEEEKPAKRSVRRRSPARSRR